VIPVLATKLYVPPPPPKALLRSRLVERLDRSAATPSRKLTLIAAPAGFGKTTLLSAWVADRKHMVAWLSLDEGDGDPTRFLTYLIAALRTAVPQIGEEALGLLQSPQPPPGEIVLTALLNELITLPDKLFMVLDDYHVIDAQAVDDALTFLIEHLPPQVHLVIATREDPHLPLARLRARDQLTELRAADLRFTSLEAAGFLNQVMGLDLSEEDVDALESRTEGWIAGLQLAALSMQGHQDIPSFIRAFAGDHRYIADYLVEEVLQRQPERVRHFLLCTSILDRLCGPLCDAVTGQEGGGARLEALQRGNFFVVPLDDRRHWYRYHHLFADVLHTRLMEAAAEGVEGVEGAERSDFVATLHLRASEWYEHNRSAEDAIHKAIRHALVARVFERAANLIEREALAMRKSKQQTTLLAWLRALPDEVLRVRPVLSALYAHVLLACGELERVEARLDEAERWLDTARTVPDGLGRPKAPSAEMVVIDKEEFRRLPGTVAIARAGLAMALGDVASTVAYARRVLDLVPEDDHIGRGGAVAFLGLAAWASGDLEAAHRTFTDGLAQVQRAGFVSDAINGAIARAEIRIAQGRLREAMRTYEQALQLARQSAEEQGVPVLQGAADMHVGISEILRERNDLDAATDHLLKSKEMGEHTGFPQHPARWRVAMARILVTKGDPGGALDLLGEAERLRVSDFFPVVRPIAAIKARVWIAQGSLDEAEGWAREGGLSAEGELSYLREFEHITLARLLLAQYATGRAEDRHLQDAQHLLERLLEGAEEGGRTGSAIEILVLLALAHQMQGDTTAALLPLQRALTLAEAEGYVRIFVDEGPPMLALLEEAARDGLARRYAGQLLAAFGEAHRSSQSSKPANQALAEPLSERELAVLHLLRTELSGPEVASELVVSLNTLRTHTKNIYTKLGVNNRRAAVRRAEELHLL
jgi:LuxR family transcriptional regulator, maltose regulon positive regulatory protein